MRAWRLFFGMLLGNVVGLLLVWLAIKAVSLIPNSEFVVNVPSLLLVPFCIGLTAAMVWNPLQLSISNVLRHSRCCTGLGLCLAFFVFREGSICLIIVSPILYAGVLAGALTGRVWFRQDRTKLNLCLAPVIALAIIAEPSMRAPHSSVVTDEIRIAAPPSKVWPHVLAFESITDPPDFWLFRLGLPYPMETTNGGNYVGAARSCRFSGGAIFKETVVAIEPLRRLTFDIVGMPADPELLGHLDAQRGQFELRDNGDGTTTLTGRTWYSLRVRPEWYFDGWTHHIFSAVHLRVMRNIKRIAETEP